MVVETIHFSGVSVRDAGTASSVLPQEESVSVRVCGVQYYDRKYCVLYFIFYCTSAFLHGSYTWCFVNT